MLDFRLVRVFYSTMEATEKGVTPARVKLQTWACILLSTVSALLMGYDIGVLSGAILFVKEELDLSVLQEEIVVGSLNLVASLGAFTAGPFADAFGRRRTLILSAVVFFVGAIVLAASPNFGVLMLGRVLTGIGVGFAMMIAPLYSAEISPASVRGFLVSFTEIFVNVGILLGYLIGFAFQFLDDSYNWRLMLGAGALPAIVLGAGVIFVLPESPRWLVMKGKDTAAMEVLTKTVCGGDEVEAKLRLDEIRAANELERGAGDDGDALAGEEKQSSTRTVSFSSARRFFLAPVLKMYIVAVGINFFQQACGIDALVYYSPVVFRQAGITSKMGLLGATAGVGAVKLSFVFVATFLLDRVGRKKLLYVSAYGIIACLIAVATAFIKLGLNTAEGDSMLSVSDKPTAHASNLGIAITIVAICAYVAFFEIGFGPITYVMTSEIFPLRQRSRAIGISVFVNRVISGTVALTFLSLSKAITPAGSFFFFAGITAASVVFIWFIVPETKGKTLEELGVSTLGTKDVGDQQPITMLEMGKAGAHPEEKIHV